MIQDIERTTCILTSRNNLQRTLKWRSLSDNFSSVKRCCPGKIFSVYSRCCLSHLSFTDDKYLNITISHKDWKAKHSYHLPKIYTSLSHMTAFKNKTLYHTGLSGSIHKWDSPSGPSVQAAAAHLGEVPSFFFFFAVLPGHSNVNLCTYPTAAHAAWMLDPSLVQARSQASSKKQLRTEELLDRHHLCLPHE